MFFVRGGLDRWPWHSNLSERGTNHVFIVNLAQIRSPVPEIFHTQIEIATDSDKSRTLKHACGNKTRTANWCRTPQWPLFLVVNSCSRLADGEQETIISDEARLINALADRYKKIGKFARPVANSSMPVEVRLSVILRQLISVDENEQFITLKLFIRMVRCVNLKRRFTRYSRLLNRLFNRLDNRLDNRLHRVNKRLTRLSNRWQPVEQPVWQPVISCTRHLTLIMCYAN